MRDELELVDQRQTWLLEQVARERRVATTDAAGELGVSVDTIRRDLRQLHNRGLVRRVHGGAVPIARLPNSFTARTTETKESGAVLAREIVERFSPGQVIGLDGGSTCVDVALMVPSSLAITIVTNNPSAAVSLADHPAANVVLLGGQVDLTWMTTTGADTVDAWRNYRLDIGILGVCGFDTEAGLTTNSANEVATKRALIAASTDVIVPVHHAKVGIQAPFVIADLDALDVVISDEDLPHEVRRSCAQHGHEVIIARTTR